jgi:hypothetical protein
VLVTLCQELQFSETLGRREALANEAVASARNSGDDATIVRVFNSVSRPKYHRLWTGLQRPSFAPNESATRF